MDNFTPFSATLGGIIIGCSIALLLLFNGRMAGISGIMNGLISPNKNDTQWRITFLLGLIIGAFLFNLFFSDSITLRQNYPLWLIALGGFLVGIGTRLGSGCTSGHGICGIANLSKRSLLATLTFMGSGMVTVFILKHLFGVI